MRNLLRGLWKQGFTPLDPESPTFKSGNERRKTCGLLRGERNVKFSYTRKSRALAGGLTGFTLLEIVITILIIGILAAIALPNYLGTKERSLGREARANLKLIAAAEGIYRMEVGTYYPPSGSQTNITNINTNLKLSLTASNWDYSIAGGADIFTAYADRKGSGGYLDCRYTLTHDDADGEPNPNDNCP